MMPRTRGPRRAYTTRATPHRPAARPQILPYVIRGAVPQAILLNDTAQLARVTSKLEYILAHAGTDGWLGPAGANDNGLIYFARWCVLDAFYSMYEYTGDQKWIDAAIKWLHAANARLPSQPMRYDYSGVRFQDWLWVIQYLIDSPATPTAELPFLYTMAADILRLGTAIVDYERAWCVGTEEHGGGSVSVGEIRVVCGGARRMCRCCLAGLRESARCGAALCRTNAPVIASTIGKTTSPPCRRFVEGRYPTGPCTGNKENLTSHGVNQGACVCICAYATVLARGCACWDHGRRDRAATHCKTVDRGVRPSPRACRAGMAMKSGAMMYRQTGNQLGVTSSTERLALMDKYQGVPTGVFQADEHYGG